MKQVTLTTKDGKEGTVLMPENLEELTLVLGSKRLFRVGLGVYRTKCLRQIKNGSKPRDKVVKLKMSQLSEAQKAVLERAGLLPSQE